MNEDTPDSIKVISIIEIIFGLLFAVVLSFSGLMAVANGAGWLFVIILVCILSGWFIVSAVFLYRGSHIARWILLPLILLRAIAYPLIPLSGLTLYFLFFSKKAKVFYAKKQNLANPTESRPRKVRVIKVCANCGTTYDLADYCEDSEHIYCTSCETELPRT